MKAIFISTLLLLNLVVLASGPVISVHPKWGNKALKMDSIYTLHKTGDTIQINNLKFYLTGITLIKENKTLWLEKESYHLINVSDEQSLLFKLDAEGSAFDRIRFNIGIDSTTSVSGAMGGDLDPTQGMYWTWQSGYINFKLEGKSSLCKTRNNEFQFHLGGYLHPFNALQTVEMNVPDQTNIQLNLDVEKLISMIDLSSLNQIMSPGKDAVKISEMLLEIFSIQ